MQMIKPQLLQGNCLELMRAIPNDSLDSIVTDPPYELGFMGKGWDSTGIAYSVPMWKECLRVLKPGGHLLSFGGSRTYHRMASAIEDAGFQIRDQIMWVYGSGFPKSLDVSKAIDKNAGAIREVIGEHPNPAGNKAGGNSLNMSLVGMPETATLTAPATVEAQQWDGWGTALKPAHEPIVLARKPLIGTVVQNVLEYGTGALNIGVSRIPGEAVPINKLEKWSGFGEEKCPEYTATVNNEGRWPANLIHDGSDEVLNEFAKYGESKSTVGKPRSSAKSGEGWGMTATGAEYSDKGSPARFFYCAKANKKDRNEGCEHLEQKTAGEATDRQAGSQGLNSPRAGAGRTSGAQNFHPTVKPTELMRYLCKMVTPPGGTVLDPFMGSGSTAKAALLEGFGFIGIEQDAAYHKIASERISAAQGDNASAG